VAGEEALLYRRQKALRKEIEIYIAKVVTFLRMRWNAKTILFENLSQMSMQTRKGKNLNKKVSLMMRNYRQVFK